MAQCKFCRKYFYAHGRYCQVEYPPFECDCPKCQGLCECDLLIDRAIADLPDDDYERRQLEAEWQSGEEYHRYRREK